VIWSNRSLKNEVEKEKKAYDTILIKEEGIFPYSTRMGYGDRKRINFILGLTILHIVKLRVENISILDVGCSDSYFLSRITQSTKNLNGIRIDVAPKILKKAIEASKKLSKPSLNLNYILNNGENLSFKECSFDIVICMQVLEHVLSPTKIVSEIYRVLRNNGILIVSIPLVNFLGAYFSKKQHSKCSQHVREYSYSGIFQTEPISRLITDLKNIGFSQIQLYNPNLFHLPSIETQKGIPIMVELKLEELVPISFTGHHVVIKALKNE